jgi:hypothetical protein
MHRWPGGGRLAAPHQNLRGAVQQCQPESDSPHDLHQSPRLSQNVITFIERTLSRQSEMALPLTFRPNAGIIRWQREDSVRSHDTGRVQRTKRRDSIPPRSRFTLPPDAFVVLPPAIAVYSPWQRHISRLQVISQVLFWLKRALALGVLRLAAARHPKGRLARTGTGPVPASTEKSRLACAWRPFLAFRLFRARRLYADFNSEVHMGQRVALIGMVEKQ